MESVVLAAGLNSRLRGFVPTYHKPLLMYNGESLIKRLAQQLAKVSSRTVFVCAPRNVEPIIEMTDTEPGPHMLRTYVMQTLPEVFGAIVNGLVACKLNDSHVMVVCADNYINHETFSIIERDLPKYRKTCANKAIVFGTTLPSDQAARFSKLYRSNDESPYKIIHPSSNELYPNQEHEKIKVWLGPLLLPSSFISELLEHPNFNLGRYHLLLSQVEAEFVSPKIPAVDIGVPQEITGDAK